MVEHIGYPSELLDMQKLEDVYKGLEMDEKFYLESAVNMSKFGTDFSFRRLREKVRLHYLNS